MGHVTLVVPEKLHHLSESLKQVFFDFSHLVEGVPLLHEPRFFDDLCRVSVFHRNCFGPSASTVLILLPIPRGSSAFCTIEQLSGGLFHARPVSQIQG
jgi:hypothetical protein